MTKHSRHQTRSRAWKDLPKLHAYLVLLRLLYHCMRLACALLPREQHRDHGCSLLQLQRLSWISTEPLRYTILVRSVRMCVCARVRGVTSVVRPMHGVGFWSSQMPSA